MAGPVLSSPWYENEYDEEDEQTAAIGSDIYDNRTTRTSPSRSSTSSGGGGLNSLDYTDIVYITIGIIGVADNFLAVLVMVLHRPLRRRLATYFLINKSVQDMFTGILLVLTNTLGSRQKFSGVAYELYCRLWSSKAFFLGLFTSSLFSLAAVSFEKYLEIAFPIKHRTQMTKAKVLASIAVLTAAAMGYKMSYIISSTRVINGTCKTFVYPSIPVQALVGTSNFLVEFLLPIAVIAYSYVRIFTILRTAVNPASTTTSRDASQRLVRARNNVIKTLLFAVLAFVVCVSYKQFIILLQFYDLYKVNFMSWGFVMAQTASFLSCCIDPIIYMLQYEEFRRGARILLGRVLPCRKVSMLADGANETTLKTIVVY